MNARTAAPLTGSEARVAYGGSGDTRLGHLPLHARVERHADSIARAGRSPLCVALMRAAARDAQAGGVVAEVFAGIPTPPGAAPGLRLLGALHHLVLAGRAPALAPFYPSVGGEAPAEGAWPAAAAMLAENLAWVRAHVTRTVQTNETGRASVLYMALLWLSERYSLPIRLLELGASAGLNLLVDRFCYLVAGEELGDPGSPVRIEEPWTRAPALALAAAAGALRIAERRGCDLAPLDVREHEDRLTLLSYVWPDELERLARMRAAFELAAANPPRVEACAAARWLEGELAQSRARELTVVWHSLFRQYVDASELRELERAFVHASEQRDTDGPVVWLAMEHGNGAVPSIELTLRESAEEEQRLLARCGDHGPPVEWALALD